MLLLLGQLMRYIFVALFLCAAVYAAAQPPPKADQPSSPPPGNQLSPPPQAAQPPPPPKKLSKEELQKNAAALEEAVKKAPEDSELRVRLGFTYAHLDRPDDARNAFETAVRLDPKKAIAHYMLGFIYEKKGLREKAVAAWKACLDNTQDPRLRETAAKHLHHLSTRGAP